MIGIGIGPTFLRGGAGGVTFNVYVDSANGDDGNDGLTLATAFETLDVAETALLAIGNGASLALVRGSDWRDSVSLGSTTGVSVGVVGSGDVPVIRCTDVATGWTQPDAGTYPNVWYLPNWISELDSSNYRLAAYEDGYELPNVASLALVNATEGRSFITTSPDGDDAIYIHATGSGDPNSNGKAYEVSKRVSGIYTAAIGDLGLSVVGPVIIERAPWTSGGIVTAVNGTLKRINIRDSARGAFLTSGLVEDSIFSGGSPRTNSGTSNQLVFFTTTAGSYTGTVRRCGFVAGDNPDSVTYESISAVFSHNDQAGVTHNCTTEQCWVVNIESMGGFRGGTHSHVAPYIKQSGCPVLDVASTGPVPITYGLFNRGVGTAQLTSWDVVHTFEHCVSYAHKNIRTGDGFEVNNCIWWQPATANAHAIANVIGAGVPNFELNYSVCVTETWNRAMDMGSSTSYTGDYNIFASFLSGRQARFRYNGVENTGAGATQYKLKWWQDETGQDANSCYILPADQTAGGANALWLAYAEAAGGTDLTTIGPSVGDFRINPSARVYSGADVAYIGTFPDDVTPITAVGPQFHWNWNTNAVASGPPTAWPTVPETEAEQATYINDPSGWDFYP